MTWPPTTHTHVENEVTRLAGGEWGFIRALGVGGTGDFILPAVGSSQTQAATANSLYLTAAYLPTAVTVDQLQVNISTAGTAGHVGRLGVWNAHATTGLPTTLVVDGGTVAVDTTGVKTVTIAPTVLRGRYWLGGTFQSGTFSGTSSASYPVVLPISPTSTSAHLRVSSIVPTSPFGDLTSATFATQGTSIRMTLRIA